MPARMPTVALLRTVMVVATALAVAGCGGGSATSGSQPTQPPATTCPGSSSGFTVSVAGASHGQSSPIAAAIYFAKHGNTPGIPTTGWALLVANADGAFVRSGQTIIHADRLPDRSWLVDSERVCQS